MTKRFGAVIAAALLGAVPAVALSDPAPPPALQALVASAGYQAYVARIFAHLPPPVFRRSPALVSTGSRVIVIRPVAFAPDGYPLSGLWLQQFPVSGCGNDTTINLFFEGHSDEKITSIVGIPGATRASPLLQRDALLYATIAIEAVAPGCTDVAIRDSRDEGPAEGGSGAWRERWAATACGHPVRVPLTFIPDATGTTIHAGAATRGD